MTESNPERLASAYLEDFAHILLSARADGDELDLYPILSDDSRARLRSRLKQISRYDWPATLDTDPALRRGYTLRQCCRLAVTLVLLDAHLPPSLAVVIAQNNETAFLSLIAERLGDPGRSAGPNDRIAVIMPAEIRQSLAFPGTTALEVERVRLIPRSDLQHLWSSDLAAPGPRLVIDIGGALLTMWRWIAGRRLMSDTARLGLLDEASVLRDAPGYVCTTERKLRR